MYFKNCIQVLKAGAIPTLNAAFTFFCNNSEIKQNRVICFLFDRCIYFVLTYRTGFNDGNNREIMNVSVLLVPLKSLRTFNNNNNNNNASAFERTFFKDEIYRQRFHKGFTVVNGFTLY